MSHVVFFAFLGTGVVWFWEEFHKNHHTIFQDWFSPTFRIVWIGSMFFLSFWGLLWTVKHCQSTSLVSPGDKNTVLAAIVLSFGPGMVVYFYAVIVRGWFKPAPSPQKQSA